jgi:hypothetical protein
MSEFTIPGLMPTNSPIIEITPQNLSLESHDSTNTNWIGIASIGPITINGERPAQIAARVVMEFVPQLYPDRQILIFDSEPGADGLIEIEEADSWEFVIPPQPLQASLGLWDWLFRVVTPDNASITLYRGQILVR